MAVTTTPRLGVHQWGAGTDPFTRAQLNASMSALENNAAMFSSGADLNARPAPGKAGRLYLDESVGALWYDTGSAWVAVSAFGPMTHRAAAGQSAPLITYANASGTEVAQVNATGQARWRGAAALLSRSSVETGVANATDSRVVLGSAGTSGSAGDTPAIDLLRANTGSAGQAWRIAAPSATGPLEIGGSDSGTAEWGSENFLPRLQIGRPSSTTDNALTVRGVTGQSGEMLRCENGAGATIASIYANGGAYLTSSLACSAVNATGQVSAASLNSTSTSTASTVAGPLTCNGTTTINGSLVVTSLPRAVIGLTANYSFSGTGAVWFTAVDTDTVNRYLLTGGVTQTAGQVSIPETSHYFITASVRFSKTTPGNEQLGLFLRRSNGSTLSEAWGVMNSQNVNVSIPGRLHRLTAGDWVQLGASAASGVSALASGTHTYLSLHKV